MGNYECDYVETTMALEISPRPEHQIVTFDEWKANSPPTLLESTCITILKHLSLFCEVRFGILYLKPSVQIPVRGSDVLLEKYVRLRHVIDLSSFGEIKRNAETEDDPVMSIFFNPEKIQTRLTRARLEDLKLTADVVNSLIRYHPDLEELCINVSDSNGSIMESISHHGNRLTKLNFHNLQSVFGDEMQKCFRTDDPGNGAPYKQRQFIVNTPNLLSLGVKRKSAVTAGLFTTLLRPMIKLQHLDLSGSVVENLSFLHGNVADSLISLCLYGVKITNRDFEIISTLKRLK